MSAQQLVANISSCTARHAFVCQRRCSNPGRSRQSVQASALAEPPVTPLWRSTSSSTRLEDAESNFRADSQTMGSLHCLWPRYVTKTSSPTAHLTSKGIGRKQLPPMIGDLAGWFTDGPLHSDESDARRDESDAWRQQRCQTSLLAGLASLWRYQGLRL